MTFSHVLEYDILTVYAGPTTSSPVLGRFSGTELPPPLVSRSSMLITFETDEGVASAGFKASYKMGTSSQECVAV